MNYHENKGYTNKDIIVEAKFTHNQGDIRNRQLGYSDDSIPDSQEGNSSHSSGVFKFGAAPTIEHLNQGSSATLQAMTGHSNMGKLSIYSKEFEYSLYILILHISCRIFRDSI